MKDAADRFEDIAEKAKNRYGKHNAAVPQVRTLLQEGSLIDAFISEHAMSPAVENQWRMMRADLDRLAVNYNLTAEWRSSLARTEPDENSSQLNRRQMEDLIREIQTSADLYQANANAAIQNASVSPSWISTFDGLMREFRLSVDRLQSGFQSGQSTVSLANTAIRNAETLDIFMRDHPLSSSASESWEQVRTDLSRLALAYHIDSPWLAAYR
jgi:phosphatidate phosphatase PAH1